MIYATPTQNLTGICIEGEYLDFYEMVESIYHLYDPKGENYPEDIEW